MILASWLLWAWLQAAPPSSPPLSWDVALSPTSVVVTSGSLTFAARERNDLLARPEPLTCEEWQTLVAFLNPRLRLNAGEDVPDDVRRVAEKIEAITSAPCPTN